jgi:tetratricopeptide (TPR) repeat protein
MTTKTAPQYVPSEQALVSGARCASVLCRTLAWVPKDSARLGARVGPPGRWMSSIAPARRRIHRTVGLIALLAVGVCGAHAPTDSSPQGIKVLQAAPNFALRPSKGAQKAAAVAVVYVYRVRQVDGPWLFLVDDSMSVYGWARSDEVIALERAVQYFTEAIRRNPGTAFLYIMRAQAYRSSGKLDEAMNDLGSARRAAPEDPTVCIHKAAVLRSKGDYDAAIKEVETALRLSPQDPRNYYNRALISDEMGEYGQAILWYTEAIRLDPLYSVAYDSRGRAQYERGDFDKAIADFTVAVGQGYTPCALRDRGVCWNARGDFDRAMVDLDEALRQDPQDPVAHMNLGVSWAGKNSPDRAIAEFSEALRLSPRASRAFYNRGAVWHDKGDYDKAIADYSAAIGLNPKYGRAYLGRARAWHDKKVYEKATADLERALELQKRGLECLTAYAWLLATCPVDKFRDGKRAVSFAQEACKLSGWNDPESLRCLASALAEVGDFDSATAWQTKALAHLGRGDRDRLDAFSRALEAFKNKRPYRD